MVDHHDVFAQASSTLDLLHGHGVVSLLGRTADYAERIVHSVLDDSCVEYSIVMAGLFVLSRSGEQIKEYQWVRKSKDQASLASR